MQNFGAKNNEMLCHSIFCIGKSLLVLVNIHHFYIDHNATSVHPTKCCILIVFDFSWDDCQ